jgi:hypothetical protein
MINYAESVEDHRNKVQSRIDKFITLLKVRGIKHDISKFTPVEANLFEKMTPLLSKSTYGSAEYKEFLAQLKPALNHHYAHNRHHPEHFENGIWGMNILDLVEMFFDWVAAAERHENGDILRSIDINAERFNMSGDLVSIFKNSVEI